ncbi:MAG: DegT/DnrJ/EryC1/StrS family aminotransferase [Actinomycetota bacterium]
MIPVSSVRMGAEEEAEVLEVLRSGHLVQGPKVEQLESQFRNLCGTAHAVAVTSGTTALVGALAAVGVGPGDEVITAPFTFAATLNAILEVGATARFADIDEADFTMTAAAAEPLVTDRTRVLMPVHLYGQPADMTGIAALADRIGARVVEDAAQAHGARVGARPVGSFGVGCFSLYATKNVTTGEGGMVTTDDDDVAEQLRILRNQGMRARYEYLVPGHNWRLTDLQAALGIPQMRRLDELTVTRRRNADRLDRGLQGTPGLTLPHRAPERTHVFHQYTVRVNADAAITRDELATRLADHGVGTGVYYPRLVHDYDCYRGRPDVVVDPTPNAARVAGEVLSLPVHPHLADDDLDRVVEVVRQVLGG